MNISETEKNAREAYARWLLTYGTRGYSRSPMVMFIWGYVMAVDDIIKWARSDDE